MILPAAWMNKRGLARDQAAPMGPGPAAPMGPADRRLAQEAKVRTPLLTVRPQAMVPKKPMMV